MRRRGRSERLARSTREGRSEPRAVQARCSTVLAPSATLSTEIHTSVPPPNTSFREFFRREALKAVGEPTSIAVRLHSLPPRAELPTQRASQGISGVSPRLVDKIKQMIPP